MRAFFAVNLPADVLARIADLQRSLRLTLKNESVRWVRPEILHLTLRFLGEAPPEGLDRVLAAARSEANRWPPFRLDFVGLGCFPDVRRPRVLWVGASDPRGTVARIASDLERLARTSGFEPEDRGFSPHLTLARLRDGLSRPGQAALEGAMREHSESRLGSAPVNGIHLMRSVLRPTGPEYTPVAVLELRAPEESGG